MAKKTVGFKPVKIKQFKDLNMWATPMGTPQTPAPVSKRQMMSPTDMSNPGNTGQDGGGSHLNIERT